MIYLGGAQQPTTKTGGSALSTPEHTSSRIYISRPSNQLVDEV